MTNALFEDIIYAKFFIHGDKFTVEDYSENEYGVYHEEMFIGTCSEPTETSALPVALTYYKQCHR